MLCDWDAELSAETKGKYCVLQMASKVVLRRRSHAINAQQFECEMRRSSFFTFHPLHVCVIIWIALEKRKICSRT